MSKTDLYLKAAATIALFDKHGIKDSWNLGVKYDNQVMLSTPKFDGELHRYSFCNGVCEGKAVFVGDILYFPDGCSITVLHVSAETIECSKLTWTKPKETVMFNGVEMPVSSHSGRHILTVGSSQYTFDTLGDRNKWYTEISNLIQGMQ